MFEELSTMLFGLLGFSILLIIIYAIIRTYTVVKPNQVHVVVTRSKGRKVYMSRAGEKSSYFHIPFLQQRIIMPLENIPLQLEDIPLRDKDLAKFLADVRAWLNISDPILAAERIGKVETEHTERGYEAIRIDVIDLIQGVVRNSSMKMPVEEIMKERKLFSDSVKKEVEAELTQFGMTVVALEVIHFDDIEGFHVIKDLESRQATIIDVETRKMLAEKNSEATVVESLKQKETEVEKAKNEEEYKVRQTVKDETVRTREIQRDQKLSEQQEAANEKKVEAEQTLQVGLADVAKQTAIKKAEADAESNLLKGKADADVTRVKGEADADIVKAKALAEAEGIDKKADAQKKYDDAATTIEAIKTLENIEIAKFTELSKALQAAKITIVTSDAKGTFFGLPLGAVEGAAMGATATASESTGFPLIDIAKRIAGRAIDAIDTTTGQKTIPVKEEDKKDKDEDKKKK